MNDRIDQIRRSQASARPNPRENPAWAHCHADCNILLAEIDRLQRRLDEAEMANQRIYGVLQGNRGAYVLAVAARIGLQPEQISPEVRGVIETHYARGEHQHDAAALTREWIALNPGHCHQLNRNP